MGALGIDLRKLVDQSNRRLAVADEIHGQAGTLLGETQRGRAPDSGRRSGDQNPLAVEPMHPAPLLPILATMRPPRTGDKMG